MQRTILTTTLRPLRLLKIRARNRHKRPCAPARSRHSHLGGNDSLTVTFDESSYQTRRSSYEWDDEGAVQASRCRELFCNHVALGEASLDVGFAAMMVAAEDDALMNVTGIALPVEPFLQRIERMVDDLANYHLPQLGADPSPDTVIQTVESYVYDTQRISVPTSAAIPRNTVVDHPGVWEDPRHAYLHCLLTRRVGSAAVLAILLSRIFALLAARGAIAFSVRMALPALPAARPVPVLLPGAGRAAAVVNTCTSDALASLLRQLKRAYWPFPWDTALDLAADGPCGSGGGFLGAAAAALGGQEPADAFTAAVARAAAHRLRRGIWTSSGGGDLRRASAAAERLVVLLGDAAPREKRDLGVLCLHGGEPRRAQGLLEGYARSEEAAADAPRERAALAALLAALPGICEEMEAQGPPPKPRGGIPW